MATLTPAGASAPTGSLMFYPFPEGPRGWVKANGQSLDESSFPALARVLPQYRTPLQEDISLETGTGSNPDLMGVWYKKDSLEYLVLIDGDLRSYNREDFSQDFFKATGDVCACYPSDNFIAIGYQSGSAEVYDNEWNLLHTETVDGAVSLLKFDAQESVLAIGVDKGSAFDSGNGIVVLDTANWQPLLSESKVSEITGIAFTQDYLFLTHVSELSFSPWTVWQRADWTQADEDKFPYAASQRPLDSIEKNGREYLAFIDDDTNNAVVVEVEIEDFTLMQEYEISQGNDIKFSHDEKFLFIGSAEILIIDTASWQALPIEIELDGGNVKQIAASPNSDIIGVIHNDGSASYSQRYFDFIEPSEAGKFKMPNVPNRVENGMPFYPFIKA